MDPEGLRLLIPIPSREEYGKVFPKWMPEWVIDVLYEIDSDPTAGLGGPGKVGLKVMGRSWLTICKKAVNLPAWKRVVINMEEVLSGHTIGGYRVSPLKSLFPENMSAKQIENAIREAYRHGNKIAAQGERVLLQGEGMGLRIEMWLNTTTKTIETAYPIF